MSTLLPKVWLILGVAVAFPNAVPAGPTQPNLQSSSNTTAATGDGDCHYDAGNCVNISCTGYCDLVIVYRHGGFMMTCLCECTAPQEQPEENDPFEHAWFQPWDGSPGSFLCGAWCEFVRTRRSDDPQPHEE